MAAEYPIVRAWIVVPLLLIALGAVAAGLMTGMVLLFVGAAGLGLVISVVMARRAGAYKPFFVFWNSLTQTARERTRPRFREIAGRRTTARVLSLVAFVVFAVSVPLALRAEIIRGADLRDPGILFMTYNRLAVPEIAELVDLYVERDTPIKQTDSTDLRILRNLYFAVEGYEFTDEGLVELFGPLIWYRPYRAYPNDIDALPDAYRDAVARIIAEERSRR